MSHLDLGVRELARAVRFYAEGLGFTVKQQGEGFCDVDTNTICLRLLEVERVEHRCALRLQVPDVPRAFAHVVSLGSRALYEPHRTPQQELVASVCDPDGHTLTVWRPLSEDEFDFVPELPISTRWNGDAEALLKSLLARVPALFRGLARRKVSALAEELSGPRAVDRTTVIRAYIRSNARITRARVRKPLLDHGIDPEAYREDFEW